MCNKDFIPCRSCPNITKGGPRKGYYYDTQNGYPVARECECHKKWRKEMELERKYHDSGVSTDRTFDSYRGTRSIDSVNKLRDIADHFEKYRYNHIFYMYGTNGTQKSSMASYLGKCLIQKGFKVQYITMGELMKNLQNDFNRDEEETFRVQSLNKKCTEADLLIVDESFDAKKVTLYRSGFQIPAFDSFLRTRFEFYQKSMMFISNVKPTEIKQNGYSESIENLITRNLILKDSLLLFKDIYINNNADLDPSKLFDKLDNYDA